mgnify:FL=1|tara:strand:+ start:9661 stop:9909 length:249 start_codon:yes stop_codon:yes gene_type:complete
MNTIPQKLLSFENIVGATLLSFFTWVVLSLFAIEKAVAVIETEQLVDKQTNEEVRGMRDVLIRIDSNVTYLREDMQIITKLK